MWCDVAFFIISAAAATKRMFSHLFKCNHSTHISTFQSPLYSNHSYRKILHSNGCSSVIAAHLKRTEFRRFKRVCTALFCWLQSKLKVLIGFLSSFYFLSIREHRVHTKGAFMPSTHLIHIIDSSGEKYYNQPFHLFHSFRRNDINVPSKLLIGTFQASHRWSLLVIIRKMALIKCARCVDLSCVLFTDSHIPYHFLKRLFFSSSSTVWKAKASK